MVLRCGSASSFQGLPFRSEKGWVVRKLNPTVSCDEGGVDKKCERNTKPKCESCSVFHKKSF